MDSDKLADTGGESPSECRRLTVTGLKRSGMDVEGLADDADRRQKPPVEAGDGWREACPGCG